MAWLLGSTLLAACSGTAPDPTDRIGGTSCTAQTLQPLQPSQQCVSSSVEGIDVFDGQGTIDWSAVSGENVRFAMIKATQGLDDTQSTFAANWAGAQDAGLARGAYHFFDPRQDGAAQAQHFLAVLAAADPTGTVLPPMLDIECPDGDPDCLGTGASGAADAADVAARMWDWLRTVEQATGRTPIVYTFASYFAGNGIDPSGLQAYPLFLAFPTTAACFAVPQPWSSATLWQYSWTGRVSGISTDVDRDRFLGDVDALGGFARAAAAGGPNAGAAPDASGASGASDASANARPDASDGPSLGEIDGASGASGAGVAPPHCL